MSYSEDRFSYGLALDGLGEWDTSYNSGMPLPVMRPITCEHPGIMLCDECKPRRIDPKPRHVEPRRVHTPQRTRDYVPEF